jgi:anti-sigma regulatory factor (Ser/Thr protein kinase)
VTTHVVRPLSGITISITRDPALVRTVRLVAAAVARRASSDEDVVEEVRLAVGEACARMVAADATAEEPVTVTLSVDDQLHVEVTSTGPVVAEDAAGSDVDGVEPWALLRGLIDDFALERGEGSTSLRMSWPLG